MEDIHVNDIDDLYTCKIQVIKENQAKFECMIHNGKKINDIIEDIENKRQEDMSMNDDESEVAYEETTTADEMKDFNKDYDKWKKEGQKQLKYLKQFTDVISPEDLKVLINGLNCQQRKIFDDIIERETSSQTEKEPYYVFIAGEAGVNIFNFD